MEWVKTFLDSLSRVKTLDELNVTIRGLRETLDVEHIVYHSVNSTGEQYAALTYSDEWVERYLDQDYSRIDPVVQGCYRQFRPVDWRRLDWSGKAVRDFQGEALDAGVGSQGYSVPIRGPSGQFAMFTVSHEASDASWETFKRETKEDLILAAHFVNQKALELERGTDKVEVTRLSPRETDTLRLLAMGFSRAQAADALTISEHTLRAYIESARFKLGAMNTTHAVARAMTNGQIII